MLRRLRHCTCRHKAKDITSSIARRREAWKEEALDGHSWKDETGLRSVRRTLEIFQRQRWGNVWETGWSVYVLFRMHMYYLEMSWTELNQSGWMMTAKNSRRRCLTFLAEPFPTASPAAHNNSGKSKQRPSYSNSAAPLFPPHMAGLHSILHYIVITLHGEVSLFWRQRFTTGSRRLGSNRDYPCVHCTSHVIGSAISSHSEHRFPAPSSKEGCRNRCLEFAISSVKAGHGT